MDPSDTKTITWDLVEEILKECEFRDEDVSVSETLAAFTLKLVFQDPISGYKEDEPLSEEDVKDLLEACVSRILFDFSPSMETIRMQTEYLREYKSKDCILSEHAKALDHRLAPLTRQIVENASRTQAGRSELYKKIVLLCVLRSGLGDPRDKFVMRESTLAVQSIFPFSELEHFMKKEHKLEKKKHLIELSSITAGIRIFNWHAKQGTAIFEDLPPMLKNALETTLKNLECTKEYAAEKIFKMQELGLTLLTVQEEEEEEELEGHEERGEKEELDQRNKAILRDSLINYVQYLKYLEVIYRDVVSIRSRLATYDRQFSRALNDCEKIITSKPILATIDVFPKFILLSKIWHHYQEEMILLSYLNSLNSKLHSFTRSISKSGSLKKLKKLRRSPRKSVSPPEEPLIFSFPKESGNFLEYRLHYACNVLPLDEHIICEFDDGYCPVTLSETSLLVRGDKSIGILEFDGKFYACRDYGSGERFAKAPETFLLEVKKLIRACPTLFRLFELTNEDTAIPEKKNQSSQTSERRYPEDDEGFKDPEYEWSEWEYRRKAILLADAGLGKNELGCQTDESLFL